MIIIVDDAPVKIAKRGSPKRPRRAADGERPSTEYMLKNRIKTTEKKSDDSDSESSDDLKAAAPSKPLLSDDKPWIELYTRPDFIFVRFYYPKNGGVIVRSKRIPYPKSNHPLIICDDSMLFN